MKKRIWAFVLSAACMLSTAGGSVVMAADNSSKETEAKVLSEEELQKLYETCGVTKEEMEPLYAVISESLAENYLKPNKIEPEDFVLPINMDVLMCLSSMATWYLDYDSIKELAEEMSNTYELEEDTQEIVNAIFAGLVKWQEEKEDADMEELADAYGSVEVILTKALQQNLAFEEYLNSESAETETEEPESEG